MGMKRNLSLLLIAVFQLVVGSLALAQGTVSGSVFEQDGTTPIVNASVTFSGIDFQAAGGRFPSRKSCCLSG